MHLMSAAKEERKHQKQAKSRPQKGSKERKNVLPGVTNRSVAGKAPTKAPDIPRIVLLPVDPYLIHAYWILSPENIAAVWLRLRTEYEQPETVLRFYGDRLASDRSNGLHSFDVRIDLNAPNWYVHLWAPDKSYYADLGLRMKDGRFLSFVRSNVVEMPRIGPAAGEGARHMPAETGHQHTGQLSTAQSDANHPAASVAGSSVDLTVITEAAFVGGSSSMLPRSGKSDT
jgi:hypothetical protein